MHFDEKSMFAGREKEAKSLKVGKVPRGGGRPALLSGSTTTTPRFFFFFFVCAGGVPSSLQEHLSHHGLRGLQQMPTVGETAGEGAREKNEPARGAPAPNR